MALITAGVFKSLLAAHKSHGKRLPRQQPPDRIRAAYTKKLQAIMTWVHGRVKAELMPLLAPHTAEASRVATTDAAFVVVTTNHGGIGGKPLIAGRVSATRENAEKQASAISSHGNTKAEVMTAAEVLNDPRVYINAPTGRQIEKLEGGSAAETDAIGNKLDQLRAEFDQKFSRGKLRGVVNPIAESTADFQALQLNRQLAEAVSVDVVGSEPWLGKAIAEFTTENVGLIKTIPSRYFDEIETLIKRESADGTRWEELSAGIEERYNVSQSRAKIIARDQVGKFYGDLNRVRQTDLGITTFVWRTMNDNRVRDEHEMLNGETFTWENAPEGGPGEAVLCRCYADPSLESLAE